MNGVYFFQRLGNLLRSLGARPLLLSECQCSFRRQKSNHQIITRHTFTLQLCYYYKCLPILRFYWFGSTSLNFLHWCDGAQPCEAKKVAWTILLFVYLPKMLRPAIIMEASRRLAFGWGWTFSLLIFENFFTIVPFQPQSAISKLESLMYSVRCQNCPEGFPIEVGPGSTLNDLNPDKCQSCSQKPSESELLNYLEVKSEVEENLELPDISQGVPQKLVLYYDIICDIIEGR